MIIGGDVVQQAIAQLAGSGPRPLSFAPVAFSFGWVAYALNALLSAVGDGRLLPRTDESAVLVHAKNGYTRAVKSWPLSRLIRDHRPSNENTERGLSITFYRTMSTKRAGVPDRDWVYWCSIATIIMQLAISVIPGVIHGNWMVLIITAGGTLLALVAGALPQWQAEKWVARPVDRGKREVVCLTEGDGSKSVIVIISEGTGIRIADLATGREARSILTVWATFVLFALWIVLLLTVEGLTGDAWYSLLLGALGMMQNVVAAGAERTPGALGFHLEKTADVYEEKVFKALQKAEDVESGTGIYLIPIFFTGGLRPHEEQWRADVLAGYAKEQQDVVSEKH
ncbi:hypothetical protein CERSUDRAFT_138853 [Gelatoporia subvermispora B]|uniref:Uncharacterized protein n=1 Tax=Ceriporiopsis subvermispora (strain B) TaxID=914234 RepID=M2QVG9_CERS8|nr:hypothetical protein CERSUDRAFT_138853 [Gelatoporia subvermispora B]